MCMVERLVGPGFAIELAMDWLWIGGLFMDWQIGTRLVMNWGVGRGSDGLASDWGRIGRESVFG